jgi:glucose-6-phosphate-specific signal transduction histidine kinase
MPKVVAVVLILFVPVALWLLTAAKSDTVVFLMVLASVPILIGLITQRMKGRTGVAFWSLSLEAMFAIFLFFVAFLSGLVEPGQKPLLVGLSGAILFGVLPLLVVLFTRPRRKVVQQFELILEQADRRPR